MNFVMPNFENLNTKDDAVAELKIEIDIMVGNIHGDRITCQDSEFPITYEVDRAVAYYVASLIYQLTSDEKYNWVVRFFFNKTAI